MRLRSSSRTFARRITIPSVCGTSVRATSGHEESSSDGSDHSGRSTVDIRTLSMPTTGSASEFAANASATRSSNAFSAHRIRVLVRRPASAPRLLQLMSCGV
jgi:hypothetical protein